MTRNRALSFACFVLLTTPLAFTQQGPPPASPAPPPPQAQQRPRGGGGDARRGGPEGGGMGIVPPGTWWRNPATITSLTLTPDQQKKLDDLFLQSRISLIHLHASLEEEQLKLEPLLNSNPPDQGKTMTEISKIADLRADLEKADAKMLLSLRGVLTADQWTKLQADQRTRHEGAGRGAGRGEGNGAGPGGPMGELDLNLQKLDQLAAIDPDRLAAIQDRLLDLQTELQTHFSNLNIRIPEINIPAIHIPEITVPQPDLPAIPGSAAPNS